MTFWTFIARSLRFHFRSHLGALLGALVGSAVLIGALLVGDSVRESLRHLGLARLGRMEFALDTGDRFVRSALADDLKAALQTDVAPALRVAGTAASSSGDARANRVNVLGVDDRFWSMESVATVPIVPLKNDEVTLNDHLAAQLGVKTGDTIVLRVHKPSLLSREAPVSPQEDTSLALRLTVKSVVSDDGLGRFSLQANQLPPFNAFVSLALLQSRLELTNRANLMLVASTKTADPNAVLAKVWKAADAELEFREIPAQSVLEVRSPRVFIDPPAVVAVTNGAASARLISTYFVNELRVGDRATPYSMVTAMGAPVVPGDMKDDEIVINHWLADDLKAKPGDAMQLTWLTIGESKRLEEKRATFRVRAVLPLSGAADDRDLMPDFPGIAKAEKTENWDAGFTIENNKIRPTDEQYWKDHRGTPKAFVTLPAGQKMWSNRFGDFTAVRFPLNEVKQSELETRIMAGLQPSQLGLAFQPVREQAIAASNQSQDFGGLFIGFSFFLIIAALLLMAMMFQFGLEQRATEIGTLLALGFTPRWVRRAFLCEGAGIALVGSCLGVAAGVAYAKVMLLGLTTLWKSAVGTSSLKFHFSATTLVIGLAASMLVSVFTLWLALRRQARQPARDLLADGAGEEAKLAVGPIRKNRNGWIAGVSGVLALGLIGWAATDKAAAAGGFFGGGALLLICGLALSALGLGILATSEAAATLTLTGLGLRGSTRRRSRSVSTIALLACGSFLVVAVGANKLDANRDATKRSSGTGGFALIGEATLPVVRDLNTADGRDFFGLSEKDVDGVSFVPMRVRDGDDASCLNLNRAQSPRLLGVKPERLVSRGAFTFADAVKGLSIEQGWKLLESTTEPDVVPAIGDANSIEWALGKSLGDTLDYTDERGRKFKVRLVGAIANSILQGSFLISEKAFVQRFPSESGYRMFLIDAPSNAGITVATRLSRAFQNVGLEVTPAAERLAAFNAVQNTYLNTFQILGGLGLLLGSAGLGVVVLRNVLERRGELALLLAVGYRPRALRWLVLSEHGALLWTGLGLGVVAAVVAVLPALLSPGAEIPYASLAVTLGAVLISGLLWTWLATRFALRAKLLDALKNE